MTQTLFDVETTAPGRPPKNDNAAPKITRATLHSDGGSRGNPGPSGIGFVLEASDGCELVELASGGAYIGSATNNQAEYRALIWGLKNANTAGVQALDIKADSELMIKQLRGEYKVKNEGIKPLFAEAKSLLAHFERVELGHVLRAKNAHADELANMAMDERAQVGSPLIDFVFCEPTERPRAVAPTDRSIKLTTEAASTSTGVYTLSIKGHFDAAHALVGYPGQCKNLHGHTWDVEVAVSGTQLDDVGIVYDFKDIKDNLNKILDCYDHKYLNDIEPFDKINATAEHLVRVIYDQMEAALPANIKLEEVAVWESPAARVAYRR